MGLFNQTRRPTRRAAAKAAKHKAGLEARYSARNARKRDKAEQRAADKVTRARVSTLKAQERAAEKAAERAARDPFSVSQVRKYLGVARVLLPVLVPLVYRGATFLRGRLDSRRARELGVSVEQLADFTGHGSRLSARIANAEASASQILANDPGNPDTSAFAAQTRDRLTNLNTAVRTAEQMPAQQRKSAHAGISAELGRIEADLLSRLGVKSGA
jgi:hypothetical protein